MSRHKASSRTLLLINVLAVLILAACAPRPEPAPEPLPPDTLVVQTMALRVLDNRDRPLAGVAVTVIPRQGKPQQPGPYLTDARGLLDLAWLPLVKDELAHLHSPDRLYSYKSSLSYRVEVPGYLPMVGNMAASATSRGMKSAELAPLSADLVLGSVTETVVLRRPNELLGNGIKDRAVDDPLVSRCLAFQQNNRALVRRLGAEFAWPAFSMSKGVLTVAFDWRGITWGGLKGAPLVGQVAVNAGVPLAMAAGQDLLPAPGVERLRIEFLSELPPEGDQSGAPRRARVVLAAPVKEVADLAAGKLSSDRFLEKFPPSLLIDPRPGE